MVMKRLTELAHDAVAEVIQPGETVVDATAGNGHDTVWLCQCVGPRGTVYAVDRQAAALEATTRRLQQNCLSNAIVLQADHALLSEIIPRNLHGRVAAVMFNLGYRPGGDKTLTTSATTTLLALNAAVAILRPGGIVSVLVYTGHPGGAEEASAVAEFVTSLPAERFRMEVITRRNCRKSAPVLSLIYKLTSD
jgi:predicted methyltransferase